MTEILCQAHRVTIHTRKAGYRAITRLNTAIHDKICCPSTKSFGSVMYLHLRDDLAELGEVDPSSRVTNCPTRMIERCLCTSVQKCHACVRKKIKEKNTNCPSKSFWDMLVEAETFFSLAQYAIRFTSFGDILRRAPQSNIERFDFSIYFLIKWKVAEKLETNKTSHINVLLLKIMGLCQNLDAFLDISFLGAGSFPSTSLTVPVFNFYFLLFSPKDVNYWEKKSPLIM